MIKQTIIINWISQLEIASYSPELARMTSNLDLKVGDKANLHLKRIILDKMNKEGRQQIYIKHNFNERTF